MGGGSFLVVVYFVTDACLLCCVCFGFSVLSQEERLRNDLFCIEWEMKLKLNQSIGVAASSFLWCFETVVWVTRSAYGL